MKHLPRILGLAALLTTAAMPMRSVFAAASAPESSPASTVLPEHALGKADAPIRVDEYISFTCSHCGEFYNNILPQIEKNYIEPGKVRFVMHNFVRDGVDLKAAQLAYCMPPDEFFPFVQMVYKNQMNWAMNPTPEKVLITYAKLGGLAEDQADKCLKDEALQTALVAERDKATEKFKIEATPTFVINGGTDTISGALPYDQFAKSFDKLLAEKH
jgi:protein-disulfide isomerase